MQTNPSGPKCKGEAAFFQMHDHDRREATMLENKASRTTPRKFAAKGTGRHSRAVSAEMKGASANEASVATQEAWSAVKVTDW
jgi:hypothetical protein